MMAAPWRRFAAALLAPPLLLLLLLLLLLCCGQARADSCAITPANVTFPSVSSISPGPVYASTSFKITCTWTATDILGLLTPTATVCLNLGAGSGNASTTNTTLRQLSSGALRVNYNLYTDATYTAAKIWGGLAGTTTSGRSAQACRDPF